MYSQLILNGLIAGAQYGLVACSFALIHRTARFFHLAHGAVYTVAPYIAYTLMVDCDLAVSIGLPIAILGAGAFGTALDGLVYRPLRKFKSSPEILLLASFGLLIATQNVIGLVYGDAKKSLRMGHYFEVLDFFGGRISSLQAASVVVSVIIAALVWFWLYNTPRGAQIRAVGNDRELSSVVGISEDSVMAFVFAVGSAMVAVAALFQSYDTDLTPLMGLRAVLWGIVAAVIGGLGSIFGALCGGFLLGMIQHLSALMLPSNWTEGIVFLVLGGFLLFRPRGLLGTSMDINRGAS